MREKIDSLNRQKAAMQIKLDEKDLEIQKLRFNLD